MLSEHEKRQYEEQGFLVKPGLLSDAECDALCGHVSETIVRMARQEGVVNRDADPTYFRKTERSIGLFWERGTDPASVPPEECEPCVNRLGHGLHVVDEVFHRAARTPRVADALEDLIGPGINIVQSMIIYKQPSIGGEMGFHQDSSYLHSEPNTLISAWIALDDINEENSPLIVLPGSHRLPLRTIAETGEDGHFHHTELSDVAPDFSTAIPLPVSRGSVVFFHGLLYHGSGPNHSPRPRRAYALHFISASSRWSPFNWIDGSHGFVPLRG